MEAIKPFMRKFSLYQWAALQYRNAQKRRNFAREARRLAKVAPATQTVDELLSVRSELFSPNQKNAEISPLLRLLQSQPPSAMLEIGSYRGGTLFLFSRVCAPDAKIVSLDFQYPSPEYPYAIPKFGGRGQRIHCIQADSHAANTLQRVTGVLGGQPVDFLFIDGDHSYEGVRQDFTMYSALVRPGGIIAFHDIVPDYQTRYGQKTRACTGGVPIFWQELKAVHPSVVEYVADPEQDGYGIGVIQKLG